MPNKLRQRRASLQSSFGPEFQPFFRWMFEMGKAIAALNSGAAACAVRTVPLQARSPRPAAPLLLARRRPMPPQRHACALYHAAQDGIVLLESALGGGWSHFEKFKEFCAAEASAPFTRDLWLQLGRFVADRKSTRLNSSH